MSDFSVVWSERARRHLGSLPAQFQLRILRKVESARGDPLRFFVRLSGEKVWRLRVGDWRVVADIRLSERVIEVLAVGHRKSIYR